MLWIKEVEMVDSLDELKSSPSQKEDRFLRGRQIAFMIHDYFRVTNAHDTVLDYADQFSVTLHDDDVHEMGWNTVIDVKDSIRWYSGKSVQTENTWVRATPNCIGIVRHKLRLRNFDARHGRIETGAAAKNWKGLSGVEGGKGICLQWRETNAVSGMRATIVRKNQNTTPPHLLSQPCHEVEVCRGHSSTTVQILSKRYLHAIALWIVAFHWVSILQNKNGLQSRG